MKVVQAYKNEAGIWRYIGVKHALKKPLVLVFGKRELLEDPAVYEDIKKEFPYTDMVYGSTAGEILATSILENSVCVTAIEFEKSTFIVAKGNIHNFHKNAHALGMALCQQLPKTGLRHKIIIAEGSFTNGSALINGLESAAEKNYISVTGGLCGDGSRFEKTVASYNEPPKAGEVILIGLYGESLDISFASAGGWMGFGPERTITRSEGNVLYEIDGQPALQLYKKYLGEKADRLPEASLLYPLRVSVPGKNVAAIRTILNIDDNKQCMTLAGDVPVNARVQLMMASVDSLVAGANKAAEMAMENRNHPPGVALLVSCVGRKIVMSQRTEEEIEVVSELISAETPIAGFYSYGEVAPNKKGESCLLHNQTMTITLLNE